MESIPNDSAQFFEDIKVAMDKDLGKQVFAYFLNAFPNSDQYILGPFFCTYPEEVEKLWVTQPRNGPTYFSDLTWVAVWESSKPFKGWPMGTPIKMDPAATKEALSKKASSVPGNPTTQALRKFLACPRSSRITKEFQALEEILVDGYQVSIGPIFLAYLYIGLNEDPLASHSIGAVQSTISSFAALGRNSPLC
ncbi:unnamed protein product [Prunus armeniaca]